MLICAWRKELYTPRLFGNGCSRDTDASQSVVGIFDSEINTSASVSAYDYDLCRTSAETLIELVLNPFADIEPMFCI